MDVFGEHFLGLGRFDVVLCSGHAPVGRRARRSLLSRLRTVTRRAARRRDDDHDPRRRPADDALPGRRRGDDGQVELVGAEPRLPDADARGDRLRGDLDRLGGRAPRGLRPGLRPRRARRPARPPAAPAAQAEADEHPRRQPDREAEAGRGPVPGGRPPQRSLRPKTLERRSSQQVVQPRPARWSAATSAPPSTSSATAASCSPSRAARRGRWAGRSSAPASGTSRASPRPRRSRRPLDEYVAWVEENSIDAVLCDQNYQFDELAELRRRGVRTIGRFVWEHFTAEHVEPARGGLRRRLLGHRGRAGALPRLGAGDAPRPVGDPPGAARGPGRARRRRARPVRLPGRLPRPPQARRAGDRGVLAHDGDQRCGCSSRRRSSARGWRGSCRWSRPTSGSSSASPTSPGTSTCAAIAACDVSISPSPLGGARPAAVRGGRVRAADDHQRRPADERGDRRRRQRAAGPLPPRRRRRAAGSPRSDPTSAR